VNINPVNTSLPARVTDMYT